jgi:hypothetical protein
MYNTKNKTVMQINKKTGWQLLLILLVLPIFFGFSNDIPGAHERTIHKLLKSYERELNLLVPELAKAPKSANPKEFAQVYFISDSTMVVNHIMPENINAPKDVADLAGKANLKISDFIKLASGLYKSDFEYEIDRDELVIQALTDTDDEKRYIHQYRLSMPIKMKGKINGQINVEFKKDIDMFVLVYVDSKRTVKYAKIQAMQYQDNKSVPALPGDEKVIPVPSPAPTPVTPPATIDPRKAPTAMEMTNWLPAQKQAAVLEFATKAANGATEDEIEKMKKDFEVLFDESGFVTVKTKDGQTLRLARKALLSRAAKNKTQYEVVEAKFGKFDQFRQNSRDEYFCRLTTVSNVTKFENNLPIGNTTVAARMPVKGEAPAKEYWKIIELVLNEK